MTQFATSGAGGEEAEKLRKSRAKGKIGPNEQ